MSTPEIAAPDIAQVSFRSKIAFYFNNIVRDFVCIHLRATAKYNFKRFPAF